jgi:sarcosine oxidase
VYDVVVVGLGGAGSSAAFHLARSGLQVLGLEQFGPVHAHGSSHGRSRIYRTAYFEGPVYVPLVRRAQELWRELESTAEERIILRTGGLVIGRSDANALAGAVRTSELCGVAHERLGPEEVRDRFPAFRLRDDERALFDPEAGVVFPEAAVQAHAALAAEHGAELHYGEPVTGWRADGDSVSVRTPGREYRARAAVLTAGAWTTRLSPELALPLTIERQFMLWFPSDRSGAVGPERMPVFVWDRGDELRTYGVPDLGDGVKIGAWSGLAASAPETADRRFREEHALPVRRFVAGSLAGVLDRESRAVSCLFTNAPDGHFVLGPHPRHRNVEVVSCCSGHGFKFTSVIGEIVDRLVRAEPPGFDLRPFDPARFSQAAKHVPSDAELRGN